MAKKPEKNSDKKPVAERIFDFLKANPSMTQGQIRDALSVDATYISPALLDLFKKGMIGRHPTPNPGLGRRTVYRYWTTTDAYIRQPVGVKKGSKRKPAPEVKPEVKAKADKIKALVNDWEKDLIATTTGSIPVSPTTVRPAPAATEANTVHHNVMVTINLPPALMRLIEKLA